jgi:hypothetical protein
VIDFGDVHIFEDVTTYPAILTARKKDEIGQPSGELAFLNIGDALPSDLSREFTEKAAAMPRARLTGGSWQLEDHALATLRAKIVRGKRTLMETLGAPRCGLKTGLTDAFRIPNNVAKEIVRDEPASGELIYPFLRGDDLARWSPEPSIFQMIVIPNGWTRRNLLDDKDEGEETAWSRFKSRHPRLANHLYPYETRAKARSDKGEYWWELRPCSYYADLAQPKIIYPEMSQGPKFAIDRIGEYINNKCFFLPLSAGLVGYLNSRVFWFWAFGEVSPLRGGTWRLELREQHMSMAPVPIELIHGEKLLDLATVAQQSTQTKVSALSRFRHRVLTDLAAHRTQLTRKLENFHELSFAEFRAEVKKALKAEIPLKERGAWEELHAEASAEVKRLTAEIAAAEREIDRADL